VKIEYPDKDWMETVASFTHSSAGLKGAQLAVKWYSDTFRKGICTCIHPYGSDCVIHWPNGVVKYEKILDYWYAEAIKDISNENR